MKYENLKKSLKTQINNLYLLKGEDLYLIQNSLKLIKSACNIQFEEMNYSQYVDCDIDFQKIVRELETLPAFTDKKVVYVDISTKNSKITNEKSLIEYAKKPNPTSVLIVNVGQADKVDSSLFENFEIVDCSKLPDSILQQFIVANCAKYNKKISIDATNKLIEYTLGDLSTIVSEILKISNFIGEQNEILVSDIESNVSKAIEFQIFELTESLGKKDIKKALEIIEQIKLGAKPKESGYSSGAFNSSNKFRGLLPLIYNHFRRLFFISLNSYSKSEYAKYLKIQEYAVGKYQTQSKYFTVKKLKSILDFCSKLDFEIKESKTNEVNAIEILTLFIVN